MRICRQACAAPAGEPPWWRWLTRRDHPLTARVMVNRIWQHHFGVGLVATASDFGAQGTPPTHPELLDWLAVELMESGWDLKHIHRLMVSSAAYCQDSTVDAHNPLQRAAWQWIGRTACSGTPTAVDWRARRCATPC